MSRETEMKQVYDRLFRVDHRLWEDLERAPVEDVLRKTWTRREPGGDEYLVPLLDETYAVSPISRTIRRGSEFLEVGGDFQTQLVLLTYLVRAGESVPIGDMITERDLKGGSLFFQGPHRLNTRPLLSRFGRDAAGFRALGQRIGGIIRDFGDASFTVSALPKIPLGFILYEGDEEFSPRMVVTFDRSIEAHFPPDVVWALVNVVVERLDGICRENKPL